MTAKTETMNGGTDLLGILGAFVKPKLLILCLSNLALFGLGSVWVLTGAFIVRGVQVVTSDKPTLPEVNEHLRYDDRRIDDITGSIGERLDRLENDRDQRRKVSDDRYKDLADRLHSIEHDVTFLYGGGIIGTTLVSILLTLNVVKVSKAESKIKDHPIYLRRTAEEDLETADLYADYLREVTRRTRENKRLHGE